MIANENTLMPSNMRQNSSALRIRNGWTMPLEGSTATIYLTLYNLSGHTSALEF